jgi:UDP-3-O-acyl N-acetylglucosamine deacetylase
MPIIVSEERQHTLARETSFEGIGLHTGNRCRLVFRPAPENSGVVFVRTDLASRPAIPASVDIVSSVVRGTTLSLDGEKETDARIHTVEHVLSALYGLGIDNLIIEVNANEPPVADGSARPFFEVLKAAGRVEQPAPRRYYQPDPLTYRAGETEFDVEPADELILETTIDFNHPLVSRQTRVFRINELGFQDEIAPSRTFCFDYEVEALKRQGLARGGSLDNAVVVGMDRIHNKEKNLRFPDEFVRHKTLDLLGDLYLLRFPLKARIRALRCGHGHNVNLVKQLAAQMNAVKTP